MTSEEAKSITDKLTDEVVSKHIRSIREPDRTKPNQLQVAWSEYKREHPGASRAIWVRDVWNKRPEVSKSKVRKSAYLFYARVAKRGADHKLLVKWSELPEDKKDQWRREWGGYSSRRHSRRPRAVIAKW